MVPWPLKRQISSPPSPPWKKACGSGCANADAESRQTQQLKKFQKGMRVYAQWGTEWYAGKIHDICSVTVDDPDGSVLVLWEGDSQCSCLHSKQVEPRWMRKFRYSFTKEPLRPSEVPCRSEQPRENTVASKASAKQISQVQYQYQSASVGSTNNTSVSTEQVLQTSAAASRMTGESTVAIKASVNQSSQVQYQYQSVPVGLTNNTSVSTEQVLETGAATSCMTGESNVPTASQPAGLQASWRSQPAVLQPPGRSLSHPAVLTKSSSDASALKSSINEKVDASHCPGGPTSICTLGSYRYDLKCEGDIQAAFAKLRSRMIAEIRDGFNITISLHVFGKPAIPSALSTSSELHLYDSCGDAVPTGTPTFVTKPYAKASGPLLGPMVPGMPPFHSVPTNTSVGAFTMPLLGTSSTHPAAIPMMSGMLLTGVGGSGPLNLTMQE